MADTNRTPPDEDLTPDTPAAREHDAWFRAQVEKALADKKAQGDSAYQPFRDVMAKYGFNES